MTHLVLFDMDGVLIDAREWHYDALNKALALFWYTITRQEHENYYDGLPTRVKLDRLTEEKWLPKSLHTFINDMKQQYTMDAIYNNSHPDFAKQVMLKKLKSKWIKIGVCSNSIHSSIELMLKKALIYNYFDLIISAQDVKEAKPSPQMYLLAIEKMKIPLENVTIVEDSPHGIQAAEATGAKVIKVRDATEVHWGIFENIF